MSDPITKGVFAFSSRRSASRSRILVTLDDNDGAMLARELANSSGMDAGRLLQVIYGDGEDFSIERSPFALGQIMAVETPHGKLFALTPEGRGEAQRLRKEAYWERGRRRGRSTN